MSAPEHAPRGVIFNTNSAGRFDVVVYDSGLLPVRGTYLGVALRGMAIGAVWVAAESYEARRLERALRSGSLDADPIIPRDAVAEIRLRKRWHGHSMTIVTNDGATPRRFDWKPRLNRFDHVEALMRSTFGELVVRE